MFLTMLSSRSRFVLRDNCPNFDVRLLTRLWLLVFKLDRLINFLILFSLLGSGRVAKDLSIEVGDFLRTGIYNI